jgi:acid phosphatase (class A)
MNRIRYRLAAPAAFTLSLLVNAPALAKECPTLDPMPLKFLLMPPPQEDGEVTIGELHELQDLQALRTRAQAEHAGDDHKQSIERFLAEIGIIVPDKPPAKPTIALEFFKCIYDVTERAVKEVKASFNRIRPYKYPNNRLHVLKEINGHDSSSYPSGHATYGVAIGLILAEMLPEKQTDIIKRIEDYGYSRMVSGVHFRSDVYAGQTVGAVIVAAYFKSRNGEFWTQFDDAKKNLRAALGYPVQ